MGEKNESQVHKDVVVADFEAAKDKKDKKHYVLDYPIEFAGEEVTELWMRRPTVADKVAAEAQVKDNNPYEITLNMLASTCGVDIEMLMEMDEEYDLRQLADLFDSMSEEADIEKNVLTLKYPFESKKGKRITELKMRRPTARDSLDFKNELMNEKLARLCGYKRQDFLDMDLKTDWLGLEEIYISFRRAKPKRR